ncbi:MAG: peptidyl-prolyl cis-trans isomerase [Gammaproteobacteria bacterium]|nr:peptidyl-prolyl cis-trans isomerase [Gammaproteobacteria bacterium]
MKKLFAMLAICLFASSLHAADKVPAENPRVRLTTGLGVIELELYADKAPQTVRNFLAYVERGYYNGTIFHRVIPGFMIQGGGFVPGMREKTTGVPVKNEADNGLKNLAGTIAMARTSDPQSAAAQFFINTVDNPALDHRDKTDRGWGYAVFGKVTKGMDVVKKIESVSTHTVGPFQNVPAQDVVIEKVELIKK